MPVEQIVNVKAKSEGDYVLYHLSQILVLQINTMTMFYLVLTIQYLLECRIFNCQWHWRFNVVVSFWLLIHHLHDFFFCQNAGCYIPLEKDETKEVDAFRLACVGVENMSDKLTRRDIQVHFDEVGITNNI